MRNLAHARPPDPVRPNLIWPAVYSSPKPRSLKPKFVRCRIEFAHIAGVQYARNLPNYSFGELGNQTVVVGRPVHFSGNI
jgi:hypothetical protein